MNRLFCWLTGGHRYNDGNLVTYTDPKTRYTGLSNHCIKRGKRYAFLIDTKKLIQAEMERQENLMKFRFNDFNFERSNNNAE